MKEIYEFKTRYEQGFTNEEVKELLKSYPNINMDKFNDALMGNTCQVIDGNIIMYHCDISAALKCGIENRGLKPEEWD